MKNKNEYFLKNCFDEIEIYNHLFIEYNSKLAEHLLICPLCREYSEKLAAKGKSTEHHKMPASANNTLKSIIENIEIKNIIRPKTFEPFQIWNTKIPEKYYNEDSSVFPKIIVIIENTKFNNIIKAVPISTDIQYASDRDIIVSGKLSDLKYDYMIQSWLVINVLTASLLMTTYSRSLVVKHKSSSSLNFNDKYTFGLVKRSEILIFWLSLIN